MSLIKDLEGRIQQHTDFAKVVSNHTTPENPEAWRSDNDHGRRATFLEAVLLEVKIMRRGIEELDCQGEWCGKSPNRHDDGLCGVCKLQKQIFIEKLKD